MFKFPFEEPAKRGIVPDGLSLVDTGACYLLSHIYDEYRSGLPPNATAEQKQAVIQNAKEQKAKLRELWEKEAETLSARSVNGDELIQHHVRLWKEAELALSACRMNPTKENALRLCNVIDGIGLR